MPRVRAEFVDNAMQPNGGVYTGRLVGKKRDGRGRLTLQQDGGQHAYDGNWIDGQMNRLCASVGMCSSLCDEKAEDKNEIEKGFYYLFCRSVSGL
ncbi:hypothetical protein Pelo_18698 [Pelomyxa schiedti]|nr:hypothetical protein Pelo_18698 [Pelomyxa schiedti]